ncbi:MAG: hypothetical protein SWK76_07900 [Actinomycetota bacterium]|nr:hypothetical protein [Actinomycetota bacterium]
MGESLLEKKEASLGALAGLLVAVLLLLKLRKRRKRKKLLKAKAKAKARMEKRRKLEVKKTDKKGKKKAKKERSLVSQLIRFTVFQVAKKLISEQIKQTEMDLGKGKLGSKIVSAAESVSA